MRRSRCTQQEIGVITPYEGQRANIAAYLKTLTQ